MENKNCKGLRFSSELSSVFRFQDIQARNGLLSGQQELIQHKEDSSVHTSSEQKEIWNSKANSSDIKDSTIILTQGGVYKGKFTLNQGASATIDLDAGAGTQTYFAGSGLVLNDKTFSINYDILNSKYLQIQNPTISGTLFVNCLYLSSQITNDESNVGFLIQNISGIYLGTLNDQINNNSSLFNINAGILNQISRKFFIGIRI